MAKYKSKAPKAEDETPDPKRQELKELLLRVRDRCNLMMEADDTNRKDAMDDLKFAHEPGAQWDVSLKKERGKRPCYEFNKLRITIKRVINHIRANRPAGKVRAVEDGDKDTAEIYDGLIRNIWNVSDADTVVDYAAEYVVAAGMGAWRVTTEYSDDTAFNQDIFIRPIKNPFNLYADPTASDPFKRDAEDWILIDEISNSSYEKRWPKAKRTSFEADEQFQNNADWQNEETTRICEYWYKKPYEKTLCLLSNGATIDKSKDQVPAGLTVVRERVVKCDKICMVIASGDAILEGPTEWAGKMFPFVQVHGEWRVIDGEVKWHGLTRFSKDAQRAYNVSRTAIAETIAMAPQAKWLLTPQQVNGLEKHWADAHKENFPYLLNNHVQGHAPPQRLGGAEVPVALIQEAGMSSEDIKATSGIFDASLGNKSNETSGVAIRSRQEQGEIATYNYPDNITKGVRITDEIIIDLLPHIYDTERSIRILGSDGAEKYARINTPEQQPDGSIKVMNDVTRGKYDVTVTSGPSFATQRQEAAETYSMIGQAVPALWGVAGDLVVKSMDLPYAAEIAERMKAMLPPQIQAQIAKDKPMPPEVQAVMNQVQQAMALVQQQSQLVQAAAQEVEQSKMEAEKAKAEVEKAKAELQTAQAQFEAKIAQELAKLTTKEAQVAVKGAQVHQQEATLNSQTKDSEHAKMVSNIAAQSLGVIQQITQEFYQQAQAITQRLEQTIEATQSKPKTSRNVRMSRGPNGEMVFQADDVDEMGNVVGSKSGTIARNGGELVGQIN